MRQAYRPPNSTGALAALLRQEAGTGGARKLDRHKYTKATAKTTVSSSGVTEAVMVPGMDVPAPPKKLSKSEKKKKAVEAAAAKAELEIVMAMAMAPNVKVAMLSPEEKQKKLKAVQKKLKQIQEIKAKEDSGATLNEDQVAKLATEAALREELQLYS